MDNLGLSRHYPDLVRPWSDSFVGLSFVSWPSWLRSWSAFLTLKHNSFQHLLVCVHLLVHVLLLVPCKFHKQPLNLNSVGINSFIISYSNKLNYFQWFQCILWMIFESFTGQVFWLVHVLPPHSMVEHTKLSTAVHFLRANSWNCTIFISCLHIKIKI